MAVVIRWVLGVALAAGAMAAVPLVHAASALPAAVDGQALPSLAPMLERVTPAVVNINTKTRVQVRDPWGDDPFFRHFFGMPNAPRERIQQSLGSGVIVDAARGYVLTNNHVVGGADDIQVTLLDGRTLTGQIVGVDPDTDVAVIKIPAEKLTAVPLTDSDALRVGDFAVAVGNPFGLGQTVTSGIVSALNRRGLGGLGYQNFIQTDAAINQGNSGGALVNLRGELIGINTMIFSPSGGSVGVGFAIPANIARDVMRQLVESGEVKRGSLGVQAQDLTAEIAQALGIPPGRGAVVTRVTPGSPAAQAGLQAGDVVTALNGKPVATRQDLANAEGLLPIGSALELAVTRNGAPLTMNVTLKAAVVRKMAGASIDPRLTGATLSDLTPEQARRGYVGVILTGLEPQSRAAASGLLVGDVIGAINQRELESLAALETALAQKPRQILLTVLRGRRAFYLLVE